MTGASKFNEGENPVNLTKIVLATAIALSPAAANAIDISGAGATFPCVSLYILYIILAPQEAAAHCT